ncbi:uncharacterized protein LOC107359627 isoform X2 [Tetranychus urticae]|uniref:uncharacterized protein LOC107359627 isoform X2 n=1 Tax=Tetranychus urticae TaxID=32264 RepID=UPI00077BECE8|nr:uncharacterized protein LOC107359627 isoform X2 [Tetranychus urticae]
MSFNDTIEFYSSKTDGRVFFIRNPYFEKTRGRPRKPPKPGIGKSSLDSPANNGRKANGSLCKSSNVSPVSESSFLPSKYDVWNNIKNSFNQFRKLGPVPKKEPAIPSLVISKKEPVSVFDQHPFRPLPGSSNQVQLMVNPFASRNKIKAPADELTKMFYEMIDIASEESDQPNHSPFLEYPMTPESPISPISPISTTSLPTESTPAKAITDIVEYPESTEYTHINPTICESNILDDILYMDFNEYEFDKMISSLPDVMDTAVCD